ncbi:hypothetical protein [Mesorhizobium sp.]|uniref:phage terminase large subunit family protein n=1 Tax=Mesorhizobium sp. TaxID=1871066 RepID=UPI0025E153E5|nr:hypothetical protein [Mesorhizobium sp.]
MQAVALKAWGEWLPFAWPRDGRRETLEGAGVALAKQYAAPGLNMLTGHARFADGSVSVEAGLMDMLDRMQSGRFKVFSTLAAWFEEFRLYHRKNGQVVKLRDDLMAATRYGVMMLREAIVDPAEFKAARRQVGRAIRWELSGEMVKATRRNSRGKVHRAWGRPHELLDDFPLYQDGDHWQGHPTDRHANYGPPMHDFPAFEAR